MAAANYPLSIEQGATWTLSLIYRLPNINVTFRTATTGLITADVSETLAVGDAIVFTAASNPEITVGTTYYVLTTPSTTTFTIAALPDGAEIVFAATGIGTTTISGSPINITGCTARMQIRKARGMPPLLTLVGGPPQVDPAGEVDVPAITIGNTNGRIDIVIPEADTYLLTATRAKYDLYLTFPDGTVRRLLEGDVVIALTITDPPTEPTL